MWRLLRTRLTSVIHPERAEGELDRELAFHIDMLTDQHVRAGVPPAEARRLALREFGRVDGVKEAARESWLSRALETLVQDVRYGLRNIRRNPGFAFAVVLTMALGIGANTAIFSVVNGVVLRPLPYRDADRLLALRQHQKEMGDRDLRFSQLELTDYRAQAARTIESIAEFHEMWFILLGGPEPERVATGVVSSNFFDVLRVTPALGRSFSPDDERHDAEAVLLLTHDYWTRAFDADPGTVGRLVQMNDRLHRVIGVLPPIMQYPSDVDVYMPTTACPFRSKPGMATDRTARMGQAIARVRDDVTVEGAREDLQGVATRMWASYPHVYGADQAFRIELPGLQDVVTRSFKPTLLVLSGTAIFVLLIVCASVANLTLARLVRREHEMAVRTALGAGRRRLLRQLLTESTILALIGGAAGLAVAAAGLDALVAFAARFTSRADEVRIDSVVLLYTLAVSAATGIVFGSVPVLAGRRLPLPTAAGRISPRTQGVRNGLIVAQVAVSFMLLVGAGLTIRTLVALQQVDPGFRTDDILTMRVDLNFTKYDDPLAERAVFWEQLEGRLQAIPGVVSVGGAGTFPLSEMPPFTNRILIEGREPPADSDRPNVDVRLVTPDYFDTLDQPLLAGRAFTAADRAGAEDVVIISRAMAEHHWPEQDPIGQRIMGNGKTWSRVVGVVGDARQQLHQTPGDELYVPMFQAGQLATNWLLRTERDPAALADDIRAAIRKLDPDQPVDQFRTLADVRLSSLDSPRLTATLLAIFAALALVITATGIAGVVAYSVNQRTQEFGIRMALGAHRASLLALVLKQGLVLVMAGLVIGTAGAFVLTRLMTTMLFGVEPTDALTFLSVAMVLVTVAAAACLVPARRAASIDPLIALRVG
jgi:putative ABC transport system permease protein